MHNVYVLKKGRDSRWYIGQTSDLNKRLDMHKKLHPGYKLAYYECYNSGKQAVERERKLKYYGSAWRALRKRIHA